MSERVNNLINNIREKSILLGEKLSIQEKENKDLESQVKEMKDVLDALRLENEGLKEQTISLQKDVQAKGEQSISTSKETTVSDDKIDELVKEIEFCIGQLKK